MTETHHHEDDLGTTSTRLDQEVTPTPAAGSTEAGIVRGVSRSIATRGAVAARTAGRTMAKLPSVGQLPRSAHPRVPVRQVAKVTDRMSTGIGVLDVASSSRGAEAQHKQWARLQAFGGSMLKNTVLGGIVFETFCQGVSYSETVFTRANVTIINSKESKESETASDTKDVFERAPIPVHFLAGAAAGSMQGIGGTVWDSTALSITTRRMALSNVVPSFSIHVGQHAAAHSVLFGSYETFKRAFLWSWKYVDPEVHELEMPGGPSLRSRSSSSLLPHQRPEYLSGIAIAGGLAGQAQHIVSHILEQHPGQPLLTTKRSLPSLRSTLWAFPPSAIAFVAFEYGKEKVVELSGDEEETV